MPKQDVVQSGVDAISAGQAQVLVDALGSVYDKAQAEAGGSGTFTQAQVDAAIKAQVDPLNAQIADLTVKDAADVQAAADAQKALADAQAKATSDLAALQAKLDAALAADVVDKKLVSDLQGSVSAVQSALDAIKAAVAAVLNPPAPSA